RTSPAVLVVQSVLTGNMRTLAEVKLRAPGLARYLDLEVGAYGDQHAVRSELVHIARDKAAQVYGHTFAGEETVLVGDTPLDVAAALAAGARAVGVATGRSQAAQLTAAGAHAVLPDLTDTAAVVSAVLAAEP
ncbi:MAG TPA: HAD hydrolase-like protein, partial [Streptosporangiaceae bacterium]